MNSWRIRTSSWYLCTRDEVMNPHNLLESSSHFLHISMLSSQPENTESCRMRLLFRSLLVSRSYQCGEGRMNQSLASLSGVMHKLKKAQVQR